MLKLTYIKGTQEGQKSPKFGWKCVGLPYLWKLPLLFYVFLRSAVKVLTHENGHSNGLIEKEDGQCNLQRTRPHHISHQTCICNLLRIHTHQVHNLSSYKEISKRKSQNVILYCCCIFTCIDLSRSIGQFQRFFVNCWS